MATVAHKEFEDFGSSFITKGFTGRWHCKVILDDGREGEGNDNDKGKALSKAIRDAHNKKV